MLQVKQLTKTDVLELIERNFADVGKHDTIACAVILSESTKTTGQQTIVFGKELEGII